MQKISLVLFFLFSLTACTTLQPPPDLAVTDPPPTVATVKLVDGISIGLSSELEGWTISKIVPQFLIEEYAHHIKHELVDKGLTRTDGEIVSIVRKRLSSNELYIYKASSGAFIMFDLSPLRDGEKKPSRNVVFNSARYAADSLYGEEGVSKLVQKVTSVSLAGSDYAFRLDADYLSHDEPRKFAGVIGFADPYWVFVYYTDRLANPGDYAAIDQLLDTLTIVRE